MDSTRHGEENEEMISREGKPSVRPAVPVRKKTRFDPWKFLATIGEGRKFVLFPKKQAVFSQGDAADAVFTFSQAR